MSEALSMNEATAKLRALATEQVESVSEETTETTEAAVEAPEETLEAVSEEQEEPIEPVETAQADSEEVEDSAQTDVEEQAGAEAIELEADQFAEILNLKPDNLVVDDDGVKFRAKVDNEVVDVSLEQLLNAYQGDAKLTNRSKEIAKLEQAQQEHLSRLAEQSNQFAQQSTAVLEALKDKYVNPYSQEDLKTLREDDPAEYAARKAEIKERESEFANLVNNALGTVQQAQTTQNEEMQRQYGEYLKAEGEKTLKAIPEWKTVEKDVFQHALNDGFTEQELGQIADSRLLKWAYQSMMYEKGITGAKQKKVRTVPKVVKAGNRPDKGQVSLEAQQKARARLKNSGSMDDAAAILRSRRK